MSTNLVDFVLLNEVAVRYDAETGMAVIEGPCVLGGDFPGIPRLFVQSGSFKQTLAFGTRRSIRLAKRFHGAKNADNARLLPFPVEPVHLPLNLFLMSEETGQTAFLCSLDLPELEAARDLALVRLYGQVPDVSRRLAEFRVLRKRLQLQESHVDGLMALVSLFRIFKYRPNLEAAYSRRLRDMMTAQSAEQELEAFEAGLIRMGIEPLTPHGLGGFGKLEDTDAIWRQCDAISKKLAKLGLRTYLNSGTLLGVERDGDFLPHDDDIDLAVMLKATNAQDAAMEFEDIAGRLAAAGLLDNDYGPASPGILKLTPIDGIMVDLFPCWIDENDRVFVYPHTFGNVERKDVMELRPWNGYSHLSIPSRPGALLQSNYGDGWRIPDPYFRFDWKTATQVFNQFLEALDGIRK